MKTTMNERSRALDPVRIPDRVFFRIGDVAELAGVKPYVLRYWETEFPMIGPQKSASGHRVYRRVDVETVLLIKHLLYVERYSIEGARKRIQELKRGGELKQARAERTEQKPVQAVSHEDAQARKDRVSQIRALTRELKQLARTPIESIFKF